MYVRLFFLGGVFSRQVSPYHRSDRFEKFTTKLGIRSFGYRDYLNYNPAFLSVIASCFSPMAGDREGVIVITLT